MNQEVTDDEGKALAKEINAIYKRTSAKLNSSIDELFNDIGKKFLNPNSEITSNLTKEEMIQKSEKLRRDKTKKKTVKPIYKKPKGKKYINKEGKGIEEQIFEDEEPSEEIQEKPGKSKPKKASKPKNDKKL